MATYFWPITEGRKVSKGEDKEDYQSCSADKHRVDNKRTQSSTQGLGGLL